MIHLTRWLLPIAILMLPNIALACAVCSAREDAARIAFIATTVFMSALPVALVFGVVWWLRKESRAQQSRRAPREPEAVKARHPAPLG